MRHRTSSWILSSLACMASSAAAAAASPSFRAVWADAFHEGYKSTTQIDNLVARAVAGRYNAIVAEVLAYHDRSGGGHGAYWNSAIVPKATDISGGIDPLAVLCQKAHAQGLEVHAWIVTYRVCSVWPPSGNSLVAAHPEWIMVPHASRGGGVAKISNVYQFDPGSPDVQEYLVSIVRELVTNYPIDGVNWDYIRYTQTDAGYPASSSYPNSGLQRYQRIYGTSGVPLPTGDANWNNFRRRTIDEHIRRCYAEIASIRANPRQPLRHTADLITWGNAPSDFSSTSAYGLFQNWKYWMENGYLDAGMPMTYYREHCASHAGWYRNWVHAAVGWRGPRHMFIGQADYLNSFGNSLTQMGYALGAGADGLVNYSYYATRANETVCDDGSDLWSNDWSWYPYVAGNLFTERVPTPAMPWRDPATATEGSIWGRITDVSGAGVDDAGVLIQGQSLRTDGNGYYVATLLPATSTGTAYALSIAKPGLPTGGHPAVRVYPGDVTRYNFQLGAAPAVLTLDTSQLLRQVHAGGELPPDSLTLTNTGTAASIYTITSNAAWISISPDAGITADAPHVITLTYQLEGVPPGKHDARITVTDPGASNSPQTVIVTLTVKPPGIPGDFDGDEDVDQEDFGMFQACLTGTAGGVLAGCEAANLDFDNDVDVIDRTKFIKCFTGPHGVGDPGCAD